MKGCFLLGTCFVDFVHSEGCSSGYHFVGDSCSGLVVDLAHTHQLLPACFVGTAGFVGNAGFVDFGYLDCIDSAGNLVGFRLVFQSNFAEEVDLVYFDC